MCEKCDQIDKKIEHYRQMMRAIPDQLTVDRTEELITEMEAQKAALHPKPELAAVQAIEQKKQPLPGGRSF
jgi:hypothetical protein